MNAKDIEKILVEHGVSQSQELSKALEKILKEFKGENLTINNRRLR